MVEKLQMNIKIVIFSFDLFTSLLSHSYNGLACAWRLFAVNASDTQNPLH